MAPSCAQAASSSRNGFGQIEEAVVLFDRGQMLVLYGSPAAKERDHFGVGLDLLGKMIEHDGGQQFFAMLIPT